MVYPFFYLSFNYLSIYGKIHNRQERYKMDGQ